MPRDTRRHFLTTALVAGGAGLSLADVMRLRAENVSQQADPDTAVIQVWLGGGPSQFETLDPKPNAPEEIRGPYSPIATKWPGILFCEMLPKTSQIADKTAISQRSISSRVRRSATWTTTAAARFWRLCAHKASYSARVSVRRMRRSTRPRAHLRAS